MNLLDQLLARLDTLPPADRQKVIDEAGRATKDLLWVPNPGPQTQAYFSEADELFYGGQAGGGKSALSCGLAVNEHERSLILRRINKDAKKLAEAELLGKIFGGNRTGWNGTDLVYRHDGKVIEFGGCELETDKQRYKGDPHDLIVFDEVTDFLESQYVFITIWNRSATQGQHSRVVATGNPPTSAEGLWVIKRWAAWLDPTHPNPAKPGELRWYLRGEDDQDIEVEGRGPHMVGGKEVYAKSRTFIPAALSDNPDLARDGEYARILDSLPEELRDAYRDGRFDASLKDAERQCIPTAWVRAAQARWTPKAPENVPMCAIGVDVTGGGKDENVLARRHDGWYDRLICIPGAETPQGQGISGRIIEARFDEADVIIDMGGGFGNLPFSELKKNGIEATAYLGGGASFGRTHPDRKFNFANKRTESWWRFREALDPSQPGGSKIILPEDSQLVSDLTSPTYEVRGTTIHLEAKEKLVARIGRSPDRGDAVVMAWTKGNKLESIPGGRSARKVAPKVILGHDAQRRKR